MYYCVSNFAVLSTRKLKYRIFIRTKGILKSVRQKCLATQ